LIRICNFPYESLFKITRYYRLRTFDASSSPYWDLPRILARYLGTVDRVGGCSKCKTPGDRPLITGDVSAAEAIALFILLLVLSFVLVLFTNSFTVYLSLGGAALAFCYPFMKRYTHLPQVVLGAAFAWAVPMAFAAQTGELGRGVWLIYTAVVLWTVAFDTLYAMVDRKDDLKIGVKSTAILFGDQDKLFVGVLQVMTIASLVMAGKQFELGFVYYLGLAVASGLFVFQQLQIQKREPQKCFQAFLNNNYVGMAIFIGIAADFALKS